MSAGGVFKLIANDGKADRMIMATELLNQRIRDIMCLRKRQGYADPTPTLVDLERTHILFVNAHFKPFAAMGYEYNKVKSNSGQATFGGTAQFSIPQFGDFFHDMVVHATLSSVSCSTAAAGSIPAFPAYIGAADQSTTATMSTSAANQYPVANSYTKFTYNYVDSQGTVIDRTAATAQNFVRYCEYPGERLLKTVSFTVNGNPLDAYEADTMVFFRKFRIAPGKLVGWQRLVGQEVGIQAYSTSFAQIAGVEVAPFGAVELTSGGSTPLNGTSAAIVSPQLASALDTSRRSTVVYNGLQTPKATQPQTDLWIPLLFWFNLDSRLSIPSVSIPYGQRFIDITIEAQSKIVMAAPGNLFLQLTVEQFDNTNAAPGAGTSAGQQIAAYKRWVLRQPVVVSASTVNNTQTISTFEVYINNIFMNPEIHDIYIKRIGFSLIRVYRYQHYTLSTAASSSQLTNLKWPIEAIFIGCRPIFNQTDVVYSGLTVSSGNANQWRDWHRFSSLTNNNAIVTARAALVLPSASNPSTVTNATQVFQTSEIESERFVYPKSTATVDTVKVTAHGITLFDTFNASFFSDYMPYHYGGYNVVVPEDSGAMMINFSLYPGTYQPSGHLNLSRARETYIDLASSFVSSSNNCDLSIQAIAINFLLISDGSAVLRYST